MTAGRWCLMRTNLINSNILIPPKLQVLREGVLLKHMPNSPHSHQGLAGTFGGLQIGSLPGWLRCPKLSRQDLSLTPLKDSCLLPWGKELRTPDFWSNQSVRVNSISQAEIPLCPKETLNLHLHWLSSLTLHHPVLFKVRIKIIKITLSQRVLSKYWREKIYYFIQVLF